MERCAKFATCPIRFTCPRHIDTANSSRKDAEPQSSSLGVFAPLREEIHLSDECDRDNGDIDRCEKIVHCDAPSAGQSLHLPDRPGLPDIEHAKEHHDAERLPQSAAREEVRDVWQRMMTPPFDGDPRQKAERDSNDFS